MFLECQSPKKIEEYKQKLELIGSLSRLFSEKAIPFVQYRIAENLFCDVFEADNRSRSDLSADATFSNMGFGIKTFGTNSKTSTEKIAEFDAQGLNLRKLHDNPKELALLLAKYRNDRLEFTKNTYDLDQMIYHLVVRQDSKIAILEQKMDLISINKIRIISAKSTSLIFEDGIHEYNFNFSKSTLQQKFEIKNIIESIPIVILEDPFDVLMNLFKGYHFSPPKLEEGSEFVILPLYSTRGEDKVVPEKSGLNQWNAEGRVRNSREVYIPVPRKIYEIKPGFFPNRLTEFELILPSGSSISAKICQDGGKALMSNPNKALGYWLLDEVLRQPKDQLIAYQRLAELGIDCVMISKLADRKYSIDFQKVGNYEKFINGEPLDDNS